LSPGGWQQHLVGYARDWIAGHRAEIALSLRITAAGLIAFALGELLGLKQLYWAVLTSVIVMQASVGGSLKATLDRLLGTAAGGLWGAVLGAAIPHSGPLATAGVLAAGLVPLAALVAWWPSYRVAPVTAIIVLLVPHGGVGPVEAAVERLLEIALGCTVALGVALAITPARAHRLLSAAAAEALDPMRELIERLLAGIANPVDPAVVLALHDRIRGAIERCAAAAGDAARERASYLSDAPDPDPLVRSLRRISHDVIMLARALREPLPAPLTGPLASPATGFTTAAAEFLTALAEALRHKASAPPLKPLRDAVCKYEDAIAELRRGRQIVPLSTESAERVFGTAFALQQLVDNLTDLADRTDDLSSDQK
jgi:uncharacterized membrane protein YccC